MKMILISQTAYAERFLKLFFKQLLFYFLFYVIIG